MVGLGCCFLRVWLLFLFNFCNDGVVELFCALRLWFVVYLCHLLACFVLGLTCLILFDFVYNACFFGLWVY